MAENNTSDVRLDTNTNGMVVFASDVVATIAGLAVTEVEGVANTVNGTSGSLVDIFARKGQSNSRNLTRGIKVEVVDGVVSVDVTIIVEYGSPVPEVANDIQENVKKAIETMTGMTVKNVDVHVTGVSFERENRAVAELEMAQRKLLEKQPSHMSVPAPQEKAEEDKSEDEKAEEDDGEYVLELEDVDVDEEEAAGEEKAAAGNTDESKEV